MTPFVSLTSIAAPLPEANVDTDIILPARFLLITDKRGLGRHAFYEWRYNPDGTPRADFPLNDPRYAGAQILVAGDNFGCGSSREHAPWALADLGFRCIVAPSFGEIFASNCIKNGMLPVVLPAPDVARLMRCAERGVAITVDLRARVVVADGTVTLFDIAESQREALLNGWDEIAMIHARHGFAIGVFETLQRRGQPWLWPEATEEKSYG